MTYIHKNLANGKWFALSFAEQMSNIGAEIGRAIIWRSKDKNLSQLAFERGLELLDLTIQDKKNRGSRMKEISRLQEVLADYFMGNNEYGSTDKSWDNYFYFFNAAAAAKYYK